MENEELKKALASVAKCVTNREKFKKGDAMEFFWWEEWKATKARAFEPLIARIAELEAENKTLGILAGVIPPKITD